MRSLRWITPLRFWCFLLTASLLGSSSASAQRLEGRIRVDGSSTVAPIATAAAEMFQAQQPRVQVTVGISGTGGGFKKFLDEDPSLRTDISDASRPIAAKELERAEKVGVTFIEVPVGIDGLAVVINPSNGFCDHLTVEELKRIWEPGSQINNWSQVRAGFPDTPLKLYGPGTDSGTFDYFTEVVVGKAKSSRADYTASESDNVLVRGVAGDEGALGYFGYSYFVANKDKLKLLGIDGGTGTPVKPTMETISAGTYSPLARPMFFYVNVESLKRPEVKAFLEFFFQNAAKIVEHPRVNYVALDSDVYDLAWKRITAGKTGSAMAHAGGGSVNIREVFTRH